MKKYFSVFLCKYKINSSTFAATKCKNKKMSLQKLHINRRAASGESFDGSAFRVYGIFV
jgi:hypothetical protein